TGSTMVTSPRPPIRKGAEFKEGWVPPPDEAPGSNTRYTSGAGKVEVPGFLRAAPLSAKSLNTFTTSQILLLSEIAEPVCLKPYASATVPASFTPLRQL